MAGKRKGVSPEELQAARDEAKRRIASRDKREAQRAAHEERVGPCRDHIGAAISELDAAFPRLEDGEPNPLEQQASEALVTALLACDPPKLDDAEDAARATGTVDESALAECNPRIADMLKRGRADWAAHEAVPGGDVAQELGRLAESGSNLDQLAGAGAAVELADAVLAVPAAVAALVRSPGE